MNLNTNGSFSCFSPNWHAALRCLLLTEKGKSVTDPSQSVEITSRKWFSDNSCVQATLFHGCQERPLRSKAAWAHHAPTHTCSFRDTAGAAKAGGVLLAPDSAGQPVPAEGSAAGCVNSQKPEGPGPSLYTNRRQGPWLTEYVRKRHWGGFQQNAFLLQEGTVYLPSRVLRSGSLDRIGSLLRPHAQPWGCSWGRLLHLPDP